MTYNQRSGNAYAGGGGGPAGLDEPAVQALIDAAIDADRIVRADAVRGVAPTVGEYATPDETDTALVRLSDDTLEIWSYTGGAWSLVATHEPGQTTCLVPASDPEPIDANTGTLADGTTWEITTDAGVGLADITHSTITPGDIRNETIANVTLTFSAPVTLLVSPTTLGDPAIANPIVWGYQNGQSTFHQTSSLFASDGGAMTYTPGAFDADLVFSQNDMQVNANLPDATAPNASTDWGMLTAPRGTVFTWRDRQASAFHFDAVPLIERDVCDVLADLLLAEPEIVPEVPAEPMSTALPTSGTITAAAGHVNYGSATLTADADIDTSALGVGDVASYELVVPAGVTLTLPGDSTIVRGSIIEDFTNLIQIEKVDTADHRVRIYSRPSITEALVFRQDITGNTNFFTSIAEANDFDAANPAPETAVRFSILDQVETMRRADGKLEFELRYPAAGITSGPSGADLVFRFEQDSNPFVNSTNDAGANTVAGFQLISESLPFSGIGGLCTTGSAATTAYYNCQPGSPNWWGALASSSFWAGTGGGIPARLDAGGNNNTATIVELRAMNIGA